MTEKKTDAALPDAEEMARQLARAPADKRAMAVAMGQAVLIGAAIAEQYQAAKIDETA